MTGIANDVEKGAYDGLTDGFFEGDRDGDVVGLVVGSFFEMNWLSEFNMSIEEAHHLSNSIVSSTHQRRTARWHRSGWRE